MIQLHAQTTIALISLTTVTALAYWYYNLEKKDNKSEDDNTCLLYTSPSPRDRQKSRMPSSA